MDAQKIVEAIRATAKDILDDTRIMDDRHEREMAYAIEEAFKKLANTIESMIATEGTEDEAIFEAHRDGRYCGNDKCDQCRTPMPTRYPHS